LLEGIDRFGAKSSNKSKTIDSVNLNKKGINIDENGSISKHN
jgi:hypothetical protein